MINQLLLLSKVGKTIRGTGYSGHTSDVKMSSVRLGHTIPPKTPSLTPAGSENNEALPLRAGPWMVIANGQWSNPSALSGTFPKLGKELINDQSFAIITPSGPRHEAGSVMEQGQSRLGGGLGDKEPSAKAAYLRSKRR